MLLRQKLLRPVIALIFILMASFVLSNFFVEYKYLKYEEEQEIYLTSNLDPYEIDIKVRDGTIIEVSTQKISGDLVVGIDLFVFHNESYRQIFHSVTLATSEYITWKFESSSRTLGIGFLSEYPYVTITVVPESGSGMFSIRYLVLQPAQELTYTCIFIIISGISILMRDISKIARKMRRESNN